MKRFRDFYGSGASPRPTHHLPGSKGKIRVLAQRVARHECPWHPEDAEIPDPSDPSLPAVGFTPRGSSRDYDLDANYQAFLTALDRALEHR